MKARPALPPGPYLIVGLARSGVAAALALRQADPEAAIVACDRGRPAEAAQAEAGLREAGVEVHLDTDGTQLLLAERPPRTVVKSPGVPQEAPVLEHAREAGIDVIGELEIGWRLVPGEFSAVTGTNGKTTTTELLGAMYEEAGLSVAVAGNVGVPVSSFAGTLDPGTTVVCEASSFQLEDAVAFAPEVGVFLNFSEDHLDRHGSAAHYLDAKLRVFAHQDPSDIAVLSGFEPALAGLTPGRARPVWFGEDPRCELRIADGALYWRDEHLIDVFRIRLRGAHNLRNAMAAAAAALARGLDPDAVRAALHGFAGVEHRLEEVAVVRDVLYVNDSKATNVAAAIAALRSFEDGVHAILGGSLKGGGFADIAPVAADHCVGCYLIGEAADRLRKDLEPSGVELHDCVTLEQALAEAVERARPGETVLLAPACASFDQFKSYEERGERFRTLVKQLEGRGAEGGL